MIYLDYNATTPIDKRVLDLMIDVYNDNFGNADSRTHIFGDQARNIVEVARKQVSTLLGVHSDEVFFTSGATESNNIAIQGLRSFAETNGKKHIITTSIEHKAVLETIKFLQKNGFEVDYISPDTSGRIDVSDVEKRLRNDTLMVSVMHVNNETGIIQPVKEIGDLLEEKNVLYHIDATQSCGKLVEELKRIKYNMLSFSAHKLRGPQGVGCIILRKKNYKLPPVQAIMYGGQQERGIRPGTIPVALVAGCGKACELANQEYISNTAHIKETRRIVETLFQESGLKYDYNGAQEYCIENTINVCIWGVSSEALMIASKQYCGVSNGSACTSKSYDPSYVLSAMGLPKDRIESSIRISWGADTNNELLKEDLEKMIQIAKQLA